MPIAHLPSSSPLSPSLSSQLFTMSCQPTARLTTAPAYSVCVQRLSRSFSESLEHIPLSPQPVVQPTQSRLSSLYVVYRHSAESPIQKMCKKFVTHQVALFPPLLNFSASLTLVIYITLYLNVLHSGSWWLTRTTFTRLWSRKLQLGGQLLLPLSGLFPLVPPLLHLLPVLFPIFILPQHPLPYNNNPLLS